MTIRLLLSALLLGAGLDAAACQLCAGVFQSSKGQELVEHERAVLAMPASGGFRVVEIIKGARPSGGRIAAAEVQLKVEPGRYGKPLLLIRDKEWPMWVSIDSISAEHAGWLRKVATSVTPADSALDEWRVRVALMAPYLEHREPLIADIAYGELAGAPYAALLSAKPRLAAPAIRRWLANPELAARQPLYLLLLGIAGNARDAVALEARLDAAWRAGDTVNLGSLIAADLELRGPARLAWVDEKYLRDQKRSTRELEAVLSALSVQGTANHTIPRARVIESYRAFMQANKPLAGFVATDLAAWQYWDAVPEYVSLMNSDVKQQYASRAAITAYLKQSPSGAQSGKALH